LTKKSTDLNRDWNQWFKSHWFKSPNPDYVCAMYASCTVACVCALTAE